MTKTVVVRTLFAAAAACALLALAGCGQGKAKGPLGSADNPIRMAFVPSLETGQITTSAEKLADAIEEKTGYTIKVDVPVSYAAVIEALGAGRVDVAWFNPLSYVLAHDKYGADVLLITERDEHTDYFGIILVREDSSIRSIEDLKGKRFAFVDPLSTSGTLYPKQLLLEKGVEPDKDIQPIYAGGHDKAIIALYNKQVDACSCYGGYESDARDRVVKTVPDIKRKTRILAQTAKIPNDNVSVSKEVPQEVREKLRSALLEIANSKEGSQMLMDVADISGLEPSTDSDYTTLREMVNAVGLNVEKAVKGDAPAKKPAAGKKP